MSASARVAASHVVGPRPRTGLGTKDCEARGPDNKAGRGGVAAHRYEIIHTAESEEDGRLKDATVKISSSAVFVVQREGWPYRK